MGSRCAGGTCRRKKRQAFDCPGARNVELVAGDGVAWARFTRPDSTCSSSISAAMGESDPSRLYLGSRERADIRAVMTLGSNRGFTTDRIGWLGYSMGGSTILMEAARNPAIQVAVLDSPYGDLPEAPPETAQQAQRAARMVQSREFCWPHDGSTACGPTTWCQPGLPGHGASVRCS